MLYTIPILFWIGIWYTVSFFLKNELILPYPHHVIERLFYLLSIKKTYMALLNSLLKILIGLCLGVFLGVILGYTGYHYGWFRRLLSPLIESTKATPIAAITLLLIVWISSQNLSIVIVILVLLPSVYENVIASLNGMDKQTLEMLDVFHVEERKRLKYVYFPSIKKGLLGVLPFLTGFSFKAGISGEVLSRPDISLGTLIYESKIYIEIKDMLAYTILLIVISIIIQALIKLIIKRRSGYVRT